MPGPETNTGPGPVPLPETVAESGQGPSYSQRGGSGGVQWRGPGLHGGEGGGGCRDRWRSPAPFVSSPVLCE